MALSCVIPLSRFYSPSVLLLQTKLSHLDVVGRPVVVLEKNNVVPEHNVHFQVLLLHLFWKLKVLNLNKTATKNIECVINFI